MWIWLILVGFIAGALAKALLPGDRLEPRGCLMTIVLGIFGSLLAGFIMNSLLRVKPPGGMAGTLIVATLGAILILLIGRKFLK